MNIGLSTGVIVGIDATNLRGGGGMTHLVELLTAVVPANHGITKITFRKFESSLPFSVMIFPSTVSRGGFFGQVTQSESILLVDSSS